MLMSLDGLIRKGGNWKKYWDAGTLRPGEVLLGLLWRAKEPAVTAITSSGRQVPKQVRRGSGGAATASPRKILDKFTHINIK